MIPGKKFNPATLTSRRPTPEKFAHLRKWIEATEQFIDLTSITEITNINQQLEQTAKLFVSNIISRVIAQLIAVHGDGFVSLKGTADGALYVAEQATITVKNTKIDFNTATDHAIVAGVTGKKIQMRSYALTVFGEVNLTWKSGSTAKSGAMDFGAADEPRGISRYYGKYPLETVAGEALVLTSVGAVQVSGEVTYTEE